MQSRRNVALGLATVLGSSIAATKSGYVEETIGKVRPGINVLAAGRFTELSGRRVGLITNQTGRDATGNRTIDLLLHASGVRLVAIFSPEHGPNADRDGTIKSGIDARTK